VDNDECLQGFEQNEILQQDTVTAVVVLDIGEKQ
jgi:hypothetical protein